jgi:hypothetical protein
MQSDWINAESDFSFLWTHQVLGEYFWSDREKCSLSVHSCCTY